MNDLAKSGCMPIKDLGETTQELGTLPSCCGHVNIRKHISFILFVENIVR